MKKTIVLILLSSLLFSCKQLKINNKVSGQDIVKQNREMFIETLSEANMTLLFDNKTKAIELLNKCADLEPDNADVYYLLSNIYLQQNLLTNAVYFAQKSVDLNSDNYWFIYNYAYILHQNFEIEQGYEQFNLLLNKITDKNIDTLWRYKIVDFYLAQENYDKALNLLNAQKNNVFTFSYLNRKYKIYTLNKDSANMQEILQNIIKYDKTKFQYFLQLLDLYFKNNDLTLAHKLIAEFEIIYPNSIDIKYLKIRLLLLQKNYEPANAQILELMNSEILSFEKKYELLKIVVNDENITNDNKENLYLALFSKHDDKNFLLTDLATFYEKQDRTQDAIKIWEHLIKKSSFNDKNLLHLSELYAKNEKYNDLITTSLLGIETYPNLPIFYLNLGIAYFKIADFKNALKYFKSGKNLIINNPDMEKQFNEYINLIH